MSSQTRNSPRRQLIGVVSCFASRKLRRPQSYVSKYERGESTPSSRVLLEIAKALGVRVDYFFRQAQLNLERVSYRKHRNMPAKEEVAELVAGRTMSARQSSADTGSLQR